MQCLSFDFIIRQVLLEDHIVKTLTMRGSAFVKPCETEVRAWYDKLLRTNCVFDEWAKVQSRWLYYLPIFSSEHIVQQIPKEAELFGQVNRTYRKYMNVSKRFCQLIVVKKKCTYVSIYLNRYR